MSLYSGTIRFQKPLLIEPEWKLRSMASLFFPERLRNELDSTGQGRKKCKEPRLSVFSSSSLTRSHVFVRLYLG